jgi:hypothetical protein
MSGKSQPGKGTPEAQLEAMMSRYAPEIVAHARVTLAKMRALLPGAVAMVYDNYNALVVGFGATERPSEFIASIALYPRWVTLFFAEGAALPDPQRLLVGSGKTIRSIRLSRPEILDEPAVRELLDLAVARSATPFDRTARGRLVIRSISPKQRPRRPA